MAERRVSGWFILSAVFIVLVFGLFFTFTERKTWPEHRLELGPMDMRLLPPVSTLWCEAVALHSDHSFVAYKVNHSGQINPFRLTSQMVRLGRKKLGRSWSTNYEAFKYFLLPSSVVEIVACSSYSETKLLIFKGDVDVLSCLQSLQKNSQDMRKNGEFQKRNDYDSDIVSSEEYDDSDYSSEMDFLSSEITDYQSVCSSLLQFQSLDLNDDAGSLDCNPLTRVHPVKVNITSADYYVIVVWNANPNVTSYINLQIMLDRTRYVVHRSGQPLDICSLWTSCVIGLGFASGDRVLVTVPEETSDSSSSIVVHSHCKPRLAVFAILSVFVPLLLFLAVAFVVRADRDTFERFFCKRRDPNNRLPNRRRIISPLLDDQNTGSFDSLPSQETRTDSVQVQVEDMPPPYHTLYDPPPPYACVKDKPKNGAQTSQ